MLNSLIRTKQSLIESFGKVHKGSLPAEMLESEKSDSDCNRMWKLYFRETLILQRT